MTSYGYLPHRQFDLASKSLKQPIPNDMTSVVIKRGLLCKCVMGQVYTFGLKRTEEVCCEDHYPHTICSFSVIPANIAHLYD